MVDNFIIQNKRSLQKANFGLDYDEHDYVFDENGLDWGFAPVTHNTYSYPNQMGVSISNSVIRERDISILGWVYYVPTLEEKIQNSPKDLDYLVEQRMLDKKKNLNEIINPYDFVKIIINEGNYYIEGKPSQSIRYGSTTRENNKYFCKFEINIYCSDPAFKKTTITKAVLSKTIAMFRFPLVIDNTNKFKFGERQEFNTIVVLNEGDTSVGVVITLKAKAEVINPIIVNETTRERIRVLKTMQKGEVIEINTNDGNEKGIIGTYLGISENYYAYWDFENDWFKVDSGETKISYTTENGADSSLEVTIQLNPKKLTLEVL